MTAVHFDAELLVADFGEDAQNYARLLEILHLGPIGNEPQGRLVPRIGEHELTQLGVEHAVEQCDKPVLRLLRDHTVEARQDTGRGRVFISESPQRALHKRGPGSSRESLPRDVAYDDTQEPRRRLENVVEIAAHQSFGVCCPVVRLYRNSPYGRVVNGKQRALKRRRNLLLLAIGLDQRLLRPFSVTDIGKVEGEAVARRICADISPFRHQGVGGLELNGYPRGHGRANRSLGVGVGKIGVHIPEIASHRVLAGAAGEFEGLMVHVDDAPVSIYSDKAISNAFHHRGSALIGLYQSFAGPRQFGGRFLRLPPRL